MKKVLVVCLTVCLLLSLGMVAFADPGGFVKSPSLNTAPELISGEFSDPNCNANVTVTSYGDRNSLNDNAREVIEIAYQEIVSAPELSKLNTEILNIAADMNKEASTFAVADLFDLSYSCEDHDTHEGVFTVKLKSEYLDKFVCLMAFDGENWAIIDNATVDGEYLTFTSADLLAYAIVVDTDTPNTGDSTTVWPYVVICAVSAMGLIVIAVYNRKEKVSK